MDGIMVVESARLSKKYEKRYIVVDNNTGEVLDDAQGYGYKSKQKAYAGYSYKNRDKSKEQEKTKRSEHIKKWLKEHKEFSNAMSTFYFEILKGSWGPEQKFDTAFVKKMLENNNLQVDFTASELLRVWSKSQ